MRISILKKLAKDLLPPIIVQSIKGKRKWGWFGEIKSWQEAERLSSGYDATYILEKMKQSLARVKNGEAVFELDTILYSKIKYNYPLLYSLSSIALQNEKVLNVLDFGGSLGSSYYWVKDLLQPYIKLNWSIIDQPHIVKAGQSEFETDSLHFYEDFETCFKNQQPEILLISGVLQCLENWQFLIDEIKHRKFAYVIIDRTPFFTDENISNTITIQKLDESVYGKITTFPCRIFNQNAFLNELEADFEIVLDSPNFENFNYDFYGRDFYFRFLLLKARIG